MLQNECCLLSQVIQTLEQQHNDIKEFYKLQTENTLALTAAVKEVSTHIKGLKRKRKTASLPATSSDEDGSDGVRASESRARSSKNNKVLSSTFNLSKSSSPNNTLSSMAENSSSKENISPNLDRSVSIAKKSDSQNNENFSQNLDRSVEAKTSTGKNSKKVLKADDEQYAAFKEKFQELIEKHVPGKFQHYNFRDMKQSDECKKAGVPKALKTVE